MTKVLPRKVPKRDSKYLGIAWTIASLSKDPNTQVGALIVSQANRPLGWGYNGPPSAMNDGDVVWSREGELLCKYDLIIHAEQNAIDHSQECIEGADLYVTHKPCKRCMLSIVSKKIGRVIYTQPKVDAASIASGKNSEAVDEIARMGGVELVPFDGNLGWMQDWTMKLTELGVFGPI